MPHISDEAEQARIRAMFDGRFVDLVTFKDLPEEVELAVQNEPLDLLGVIEPPHCASE